MNRRSRSALLLLAGIVVAGCSSGPSPIVTGRDQCAHCKMAISDLRFASQLITDKGKRYTFDSIECMIRSTRSDDMPGGSIWVADYEMPDTWLPAEEAIFLYSGRIHSPMGAGLSAFGPPATSSGIRQTYGGTVMNWREVQAWLETSDHPDATGQDQTGQERPTD